MAAADAAYDAKIAAAMEAAAGATSDTGVSTAISYGISEALLASYPELQAVYALFKQGKSAAALEALYKTDYYRNLSPAVKTRSKLKLEQPGVYADSFDKYKLSAKKRLVSTGIKIDDETLNQLAQQAYDQGLDDNQFDVLIKTSGKILGYGGQTLGSVSDLQSYSRAFGVDNMFNKAYWDTQSAELAIGNTTAEDIQANIREVAASAYPSYAESIRKGVSVDALASAYKASYASILEVDPDSVDYNNPRLRRALQYIDPKTGQPGVMPIWQFEKDLRSTPEWEYTNNARDTMDSLTLKVFRDMGLA
jgi:hypothetical protein